MKQAISRWRLLGEEITLIHPYVSVKMQSLQLEDGQIIRDWPIVQTLDYVNAMVLDAAGQVMILEGYKHGLGHSSWQVVGGYLEKGEEPLAAIQRELLEETGYRSDHWQELGSFVMDANRRVGTGTFFLARHAYKAADAAHDDLESFTVRWVTPMALRAALFDGRIAIASYAINVAMGLLVMETGGLD